MKCINKDCKKESIAKEMCRKHYMQKYRMNENAKLYQREYRKKHNQSDSHKKYNKIYAKKNSDKVNAWNANRRAMKKQATPKWLTKDHYKLIEMYYQLAKYMTEVTGIKYDVDHIIPLKGINVRGLHVPWNLRVIPESENCSKYNKMGVK